jgi:hypothetical protein
MIEDVRDVYLEDFADTDDEVEDEDDEERAMRREERRKVGEVLIWLILGKRKDESVQSTCPTTCTQSKGQVCSINR